MMPNPSPRSLSAAAAIACASLALPAAAALTCEQLFAIAESTVQFRDQGNSLQQVLAGLKDKEIGAKLSAGEVQVLHKTVTAVYLGSATAAEIALECKEAEAKKK
jgi:hypothetical protein